MYFVLHRNLKTDLDPPLIDEYPCADRRFAFACVRAGFVVGGNGNGNTGYN